MSNKNYNKDKNIMENITKGTGLIEHYIYRYIVYFLIKHLKLNINPNIITFLSLLYVIFCSILIISKKFAVVGVILYVFFNILDLLDGAVARIYNRKSKFGAFFDGLVDLVGEILILLSVGYYFGKLDYFVWLVAFIIFVHYFSIRVKWIYSVKERQLNMFDYIKSPLFLVVLFTRNDTRKVLLLIGFLLNSWKFIFYYFLILYIIALVGNLRTIWNGEFR